MAGLPTVNGITGPWSTPGDAPSATSAGITGNNEIAGQKQMMEKLLASLLSDPAMLQMLAKALAQGGMGGAGGALGGPQQPGAVQSPLSQPGLWGSEPQGGHVQWMGGMPPGYNDKVAKQLSATAIGGNLLSPVLAALLGGRK